MRQVPSKLRSAGSGDAPRCSARIAGRASNRGVGILLWMLLLLLSGCVVNPIPVPGEEQNKGVATSGDDKDQSGRRNGATGGGGGSDTAQADAGFASDASAGASSDSAGDGSDAGESDDAVGLPGDTSGGAADVEGDADGGEGPDPATDGVTPDDEDGNAQDGAYVGRLAPDVTTEV